MPVLTYISKVLGSVMKHISNTWCQGTPSQTLLYTCTRLTACTSGKEGSGQTVSTGQGWNLRKGARMQFPTCCNRWQVVVIKVSIILDSRARATATDPSFPLTHAVKRVRVCMCIEGSGDQTRAHHTLRCMLNIQKSTTNAIPKRKSSVFIHEQSKAIHPVQGSSAL